MAPAYLPGEFGTLILVRGDPGPSRVVARCGTLSFERRATNLLGRKSSQFLDYKQGRRKSTAVKTELVLPRPTVSMRRRCCTLGSEEPCGRSTSPLRTECASRSYKWHFGAEWCLTSSQLLVGRLRNTLQGPRLPVVINGEAAFGIARLGAPGMLQCTSIRQLLAGVHRTPPTQLLYRTCSVPTQRFGWVV